MFAQNRPDNVGTQLYKPIGHFYVDSHAPSLHANNSEIGAKTVNIKMSYRFIYIQHRSCRTTIRYGPYTTRIVEHHRFKRFVYKGKSKRT